MPKNTNKKTQPAFFQQAALHANLTNFLQQTTARLSDFIPQATTSYWYFCG
jgi:hypothetical protein